MLWDCSIPFPVQNTRFLTKSQTPKQYLLLMSLSSTRSSLTKWGESRFVFFSSCWRRGKSYDFFLVLSLFYDKDPWLGVQIPLPPVDEKKKVIEDVDKDRRYAIDASIVRIMKSRKVLGYQQLVMECVEQLGRMFKVMLFTLSLSLKLSWTFINYQLLYILIWFTRTAWCESNKKEDRRFDHPGLFGTGQGQPEHVQVLGMIWLFIRRYKRRTGFLVWKNEPKLLYMISKRVLLAHFEGWLETGAFYFLVH